MEPPPRLTVAEWADQFRYLSPEASAEPGKWSNARAPHTIKPMEALSPHDPCEQVVLKWSSQSSKTESILNFIGYIVDQDPGPILVVQPNLKPMGEAFSKDRIAPMIRDTPVLKSKVFQNKGRDSANTMLQKSFPNGHLTIGGASSPAQLASRPIRYLLCDEIDRWEATKEGDPLKLAKKRTLTFWNRKILMVSSPTIEGVGIDAEYQNSLKHEWHIKCQHCGNQQFPQFKHFLFDRNQHNEPENIRFVCEECGAEHSQEEEFKLKATGEWVQTNTASNRIKGFWFNQFGSPFATWRETITEFLEAKDDPIKLQAVINTAFAECWRGTGVSLDWQAIRQRREVYPTDDGELLIPEDVQILFCIVDTQDSWLDVEIIGFNEDRQSWGIENIQLHGQTDEQHVWDQLDRIREKQYRTEADGVMSITACAIDIKGHRTKIAKDYCLKNQFANVFAFQGAGSSARSMISKSKQPIENRSQRKVTVYTLRVDDIKRIVQADLSKHDSDLPGYCHFPMLKNEGDANGYDTEYFQQLCAEKQEARKVKGFERIEWVKTRTRNEAFDKRVYATALLQILNPNWSRLVKRKKPEPEVEAPEAAPKKPQRQRKKSWFKR